MEDNEPRLGFFDDDGTPINADLIPKPSLCVSCKKDEQSEEKIFCVLTRFDQRDEGDFRCDAYAPKQRE